MDNILTLVPITKVLPIWGNFKLSLATVAKEIINLKRLIIIVIQYSINFFNYTTLLLQ